MRRSSAMITSTGRTQVWLGASFWSRGGGPRMWSRDQPDLVRSENDVTFDVFEPPGEPGLSVCTYTVEEGSGPPGTGTGVVAARRNPYPRAVV